MTGFKSRARYLRLLPGVVLVCAALIALKVSGVVHDAFAQDGQPAPADALAPGPKSANPDFAGDDGQATSAAEVDVLTSLSKRRAELDARQSQIQSQANILAATETRVDAKIAQLKDLQNQISGLLAQRDAEQEKQVAALVKIYASMPPASAASIFNALPDGVLIPVAQEMKSDTLALVLAKMSPEAAQKLTIKLANKLTLPDTTAAMAPAAAPAVPSGTPAAPGQETAGAAASSPVQPKS